MRMHGSFFDTSEKTDNMSKYDKKCKNIVT